MTGTPATRRSASRSRSVSNASSLSWNSPVELEGEALLGPVGVDLMAGDGVVDSRRRETVVLDERDERILEDRARRRSGAFYEPP